MYYIIEPADPEDVIPAAKGNAKGKKKIRDIRDPDLPPICATTRSFGAPNAHGVAKFLKHFRNINCTK